MINMTSRVRDKTDMHSPYRKFHGRPPFARLLPFLKPVSPREKDRQVGAHGGGLFLLEERKPPLGRLLQDSAEVWTAFIIPRRYLAIHEEIVRGVTAHEGEGLSAATVTATIHGNAVISGRSQNTWSEPPLPFSLLPP